MNGRRAPVLEAVDGRCKILAESLCFDLANRVGVCVETKDDCFGVGQTMQSLALAAKEGLDLLACISQKITRKKTYRFNVQLPIFNLFLLLTLISGTVQAAKGSKQFCIC